MCKSKTSDASGVNLVLILNRSSLIYYRICEGNMAKNQSLITTFTAGHLIN